MEGTGRLWKTLARHSQDEVEMGTYWPGNRMFMHTLAAWWPHGHEARSHNICASDTHWVASGALTALATEWEFVITIIRYCSLTF